MALPSSYPAPDSTPLLTGVVLSIIPGDATKGAEIARSSDNGSGAPASSAAVSVAALAYLPTAGSFFVDLAPQDGAKRYYQARAYDPKGSLAPSAWTAWTSGNTPAPFDPYYQKNGLQGVAVYPFNPIPVQTDGTWNLASQTVTRNTPSTALYLPTTAALVVGTSGTPSTISKTMRFTWNCFNASPSSATKVTGGSGNYVVGSSVAFGVAGSGLLLLATLTLPLGVTITGIAGVARAQSSSTSDTVSIAVNKLPSTAPDASPTSLASFSLSGVSQSGSNWQSGSAALSELVTSSGIYYLPVALNATSSGSASWPGFAYMDVIYSMPDYSRSL